MAQSRCRDEVPCELVVDLTQLARGIDSPSIGVLPRPLAGRHVALLFAESSSPRRSRTGDAFERCARSLGANVAWLPVSPPFQAQTLALLPRLYDLVYCDGDVAGLCPAIGEATGLPCLSGLWRPWDVTGLVTLLLLIGEKDDPDTGPMDVVCRHPSHRPRALGLVTAARRLGVAARIRTATPRGAVCRVETNGEGYAAWRLYAPADPSCGHAAGRSPSEALHDAAIKSVLLRALDNPSYFAC